MSRTTLRSGAHAIVYAAGLQLETVYCMPLAAGPWRSPEGET